MEDGLPTGLPEGVGEYVDETVKSFPVVIGVFTGLPHGDCGIWEDCAPGTVVGEPPGNVVGNAGVGESEELVCEDCGVTFWGLSEVDCWLDVCWPGVERFVTDVVDGEEVLVVNVSGINGREVGMDEGGELSIDESSEVSMDKLILGEVGIINCGEVGIVKGGGIDVDEGKANMTEGSDLGSFIEVRSLGLGQDSSLGGEGLVSDETLAVESLFEGSKVRPALTGGVKVVIPSPGGSPFVGAPPPMLIDECEEGKMDVNVSVLAFDLL